MDTTRTIGIELWSDQARGFAGNHPTRIARAYLPPASNLRELFVAAYPRFADACRRVDEPGLAIIAIDETTGRPAGLVRLRAQVRRHVAAIIGRHDACDLYLASHDQLALRHLAVIADPLVSWTRGVAPCTYRIVDLRSQDGFRDEHGRTLRGMRCEGAAIVRCGGYALFVLPLGDPTDWPAAGAEAWAFLPERVYFDEVSRHARCSPAVPRADWAHRRTHITRVSGPHEPNAKLVTNGDLAGTLELEGPNWRKVVEVGDAALDDGVLLGRYDRCDGRGSQEPSLSRVHALLIRIDKTLLVIDAASTFGTARLAEPAARVIELDRDAMLQLGLATLARWRWRS